MPEKRKSARFSVDVPSDVRRQMHDAEDGIPDATRARLLLEEWARDPELREVIEQRHRELLIARSRLRHAGSRSRR